MRAGFKAKEIPCISNKRLFDASTWSLKNLWEFRLNRFFGFIRFVELSEWTTILISVLIRPFSNYLLLGMWVFKDKLDVNK